MNIRKKILFFVFFAVLITSLVPQNIYLIVLFSILCWFMLPLKRWWDAGAIALLLFSLFYAIMVLLGHNVTSGFLLVTYAIAPVAFYRFGQFLMQEFRDANQRFKILLYILTAYLINLIILTIIDISVVGVVNMDRTLSVMGESESMSATLYGLMLTFGLGGISAIFAKEQKLWMRIVYLLLAVCSIMVVVHLINRGGLVVIAVCLTLSLLITLRKRPVTSILVMSFILLVAIVIMSSDFINDEIISVYKQRNEVKGYDASSAGGRTDLWMMSIKKLFHNPFGWTQKKYAHNLWLDVARIGGWISLIPLFYLTIRILNKTLKLLLNAKSSFYVFIVVLNVGLLLGSFIEPVIEGSILFFNMMMMVWGIIHAVYNENYSIRLSR